jgi:endonuclease/exonuclease/phosphatase family metal-dependent hydrolase
MAESVEIRLLCYNIRSLRDDRDAVTAVIRHCRPDVVCVQEAPRFWRWRTHAAWLANESGLAVVTGGRPAGLLLLAALRMDVRASRAMKLSRTPLLHQRGLATAVLEVSGARFMVGSFHLDLEPAARLRHAREILGHIKSAGVPVILAGDVNEDSRGAAWRALAERLPDAWSSRPVATYSSREPVQQIDAVFADPAVEVISCEVPDDPEVRALSERASDHRPVLAVLRVPVETN